MILISNRESTSLLPLPSATWSSSWDCDPRNVRAAIFQHLIQWQVAWLVALSPELKPGEIPTYNIKSTERW